MIDVMTHRVSAQRLLARAQRRKEEEDAKARVEVLRHFDDGALLFLRKQKPKSVYSGLFDRGPVSWGDDGAALRCGPNHVHALITHPDGSQEDLGVSENLLTNIGRDWWAQAWGDIGAGVLTASPATATTGTSITTTGTPLTASNLATPQLGVAGLRVQVPVTGVTTAPVYGNIVSNTTSVITIDQWWTEADGVGTTPASTNAFIISPGGIAAARFIGLTTNASAAAAADTTLTGEITTGGCNRQLGTYAHTYGQATLTLTKAFSVTGSFTAIHKAGLFACLTAAGADPMLYETVMNADATVANGDTLTLTWTFTLSG